MLPSDLCFPYRKCIFTYSPSLYNTNENLPSAGCASAHVHWPEVHEFTSIPGLLESSQIKFPAHLAEPRHASPSAPIDSNS